VSCLPIDLAAVTGCITLENGLHSPGTRLPGCDWRTGVILAWRMSNSRLSARLTSSQASCVSHRQSSSWHSEAPNESAFSRIASPLYFLNLPRGPAGANERSAFAHGTLFSCACGEEEHVPTAARSELLAQGTDQRR
jgi:hypothetical protein